MCPKPFPCQNLGARSIYVGVGVGGGGANGGLLTFRRAVQKRESLDFRSPEVGISGEEVDLTIAIYQS